MKIKGACVLVGSPKDKSKIPSGFKQELFNLVVETGIKMCSEVYESNHLKHLKELSETITVTPLFNGLHSNTSF